MKRFTKKEFYEALVPEPRRNDSYQNHAYKMFSKVTRMCNGDFTHQITPTHVNIVGVRNGCKIFFSFTRILNDNYRWSKKPPKAIYPYKIISATGHEIIEDFRRLKYYWGVKIDNKYVQLKPAEKVSFTRLIERYPNLEDLYQYQEAAYKDSINSNTDCWVKVSIAPSYYDRGNYILCIKPFSNFRVGDIIDKSEKYFTRFSVNDAINNVYADFRRYTFNIADPLPPLENFSCRKSGYTCSYACHSGCAVKSQNKLNKELYKKIDKLREKYELSEKGA
jgi:hypothetical protein